MVLSRGYTLASPEFRDTIPVRPLSLTGDSTLNSFGNKPKTNKQNKKQNKNQNKKQCKKKKKIYNNTGDTEVLNLSGTKKKPQKTDTTQTKLKNQNNKITSIFEGEKQNKNKNAPR